MPASVRPTSTQPVNRFLAFHSLCPCRSSTNVDMPRGYPAVGQRSGSKVRSRTDEQQLTWRHDRHERALIIPATHQHSYGKDVQAELRDPALALRSEIPDVYDGFPELHDAAFADGALDRKTKELIALAIATAQHCDGCMASHARSAARSGATEPRWPRRLVSASK